VSAGIVVTGLCAKRANRPVLSNVSLHIPPGEITALLGSNGAGKSTLVAVIAGLLRPTAGKISVDGARVTGLSPQGIRGLGVAVVPEGHRVLAELSVEDNLRASLSTVRRRSQAERIRAALERFPELRDHLRKDAGSLSGGQQQMLALAQALAVPPRYLVVDELSLGLAPILVDRLKRSIQDLATEGVGVLLIEQFTMLALEVSARAYVLQRGQLTLEGSSQDLRADRAALARAYLSAADTSALVPTA
jgi:branched-chain amino acid transport system ATP-binding protein